MDEPKCDDSNCNQQEEVSMADNINSNTEKNLNTSRNQTNEVLENRRDEADVLSDQDITTSSRPHEIDENLGAKSRSLGDLEKEPIDFMSGEIDVKEQMDRATEAFEDSILGIQENADGDDPEGELEASYRATPGGLEEVIAKSDKDQKR